MENENIFQDNLLLENKQQLLKKYELELSEIEASIDEVKNESGASWDVTSKEKEVKAETSESDEDVTSRLSTESAKYYSHLLAQKAAMKAKIADIRKEEFSLN